MTIYPAQTLAVVGESGCGKSVTALSLMHLLARPPARFDRGRAMFVGEGSTEPVDLLAMDEAAIRRIRGGQIAMIFQEPMTSLNPVLTVGDQICEAVRLHRTVGSREARGIAAEALRTVGIADAGRRLDDYPHQFSGGMRQRVMIAMALACQPRLLLADEPTTALDATVQKQILELLDDLKARTGLAVMLITHDLGVVRDHAEVVCVMYAGRVVEYARAEELFRRPLHPYTRALLACVPSVETRERRLTTIAETVREPGFLVIPAEDLGGRAPMPWWPGREDGAYVLSPLLPDHWVAVAEGSSAGSEVAWPDLAPFARAAVAVPP
jgi:ABC-type dipeptide/oligopeptide/nickel transport system ATPase component